MKVIVDGARSAFGNFGGGLKPLPSVDLDKQFFQFSFPLYNGHPCLRLTVPTIKSVVTFTTKLLPMPGAQRRGLPPVVYRQHPPSGHLNNINSSFLEISQIELQEIQAVRRMLPTSMHHLGGMGAPWHLASALNGQGVGPLTVKV